MSRGRFLPIADRAELVAALRSTLGRADGWVQAVGFVEEVELRVAGEGVDPRRLLRGRWSLGSFQGPAAGPYGVVVCRATEAGVEVAAGHLVTARASGVTAWLTEAATEAPCHAGSELEEPEAAAPSPPEAAPLAPGNAWAALAAQAVEAAAPAPPSLVAPLQPRRGDRVQHFSFGLCDVLLVTGQRYKLRDVQGPGRIREVDLGYLDVKPLPDRDGKRVFKLSRRSG